MSISVNIVPAGAIASRDALKQWCAEEVDRDLTEATPSGTLSDNFDKWIAMAEARFNRELRTPDMETTVTLSATEADTALPDDYLAMRAIYEDGSPDSPLSALPPPSVRQEYDGTPGQPQAYILVSGGLRLVPPPDTQYLLSLDYYAKIEALSDVVPYNWLLLKHPDAYVTAVLFHYFRWSKDRESAIDANTLCTSIIADINQMSRADRYGAGPLARATVRQTGSGRC
jgi:hypothetical protein